MFSVKSQPQRPTEFIGPTGTDHRIECHHLRFQPWFWHVPWVVDEELVDHGKNKKMWDFLRISLGVWLLIVDFCGLLFFVGCWLLLFFIVDCCSCCCCCCSHIEDEKSLSHNTYLVLSCWTNKGETIIGETIVWEFCWHLTMNRYRLEHVLTCHC